MGTKLTISLKNSLERESWETEIFTMKSLVMASLTNKQTNKKIKSTNIIEELPGTER